MNISNSIKYVGVNDHKIDLFEGQFEVPLGMAYNSYIILDEKNAVIDSVDQNFGEQWIANIQKELGGKKTGLLSGSAYGDGSLCKYSGFYGKISRSKNCSF